MKEEFDIRILKLNWLKGLEEAHDRCVHGKIFVRIGDEIVSDESTGEWTLSTTGLYLMRTIEKGYKIGDYGSQLIPCCGHFFVAEEGKETVEIIGCPNGIDWTIEHAEKNTIKHTSESGQIGTIDREIYKKKVLKVVDEIEQFYEKSESKEMPEDEFDKKGYLTFWKEWKTLRDRYSSF